MPPKPEPKPERTGYFSYAIEIVDKNGDFIPTNRVIEPIHSDSTPNNAKTSSVRYLTNEDWTQLDKNRGSIAFQTVASRLNDKTTRVRENMQITLPDGTNHYSSIYNDGGIDADGITSTGTTAKYDWLGGSDPKMRDVSIAFKQLPNGQKIRTGHYVDNVTNMALGDDDRNEQDQVEEDFLTNIGMNGKRPVAEDTRTGMGDDDNSSHDSDSEAHDDDKKKNNGSFGMSMGLLRKIFD